METQWFYSDGGQQQGPVTMDELVRAVRADPGRFLVWREGLAEWQDPRSVPELLGLLPPPAPAIQPGGGGSVGLAEDAETIARLYRRLVLLVGLQIFLSFFFQLLTASISSTAAGLLALPAMAATVVLLVAIPLTGYRLAGHLGESSPLLWAIAMLIPCLNILTLLLLSSKAQAWCKSHGIAVGLLGPTKESIEELRRRLQSSHFD